MYGWLIIVLFGAVLVLFVIEWIWTFVERRQK